jgi:hypothetical protein
MCTSESGKMLRCSGTQNVSSENIVSNCLPSVAIQVMYITYIFIPLLNVGCGRNPDSALV